MIYFRLATSLGTRSVEFLLLNIAEQTATYEQTEKVSPYDDASP